MLLSLVFVLLMTMVVPTGVSAQGGPGKGNPPPGQEKPKGGEGDQGNNGAPGNSGEAVKAVGQLAAQGNNPVETRLINMRASRLIGLPIVNRAGKEIGRVADVLVNLRGQRQSGNGQQPANGGPVANGRADYLVARFGDVLGWGGETVPVPLTALRLHVVDGGALGFDDNLVYFPGTEPGDNAVAARKQFFNGNTLVLAGQEQDLKGAPQYDLNQLRNDADPSWDRSLRAYWQGLGTSFPEDKAGDGAAYRVASVQNLDRFGLRELGGNGLGSVADVLLTLGVANPSQVPVAAAEAAVNSGNNGNGNNADDQKRAAAAAPVLAQTLPIVGSRMDYVLVNHGGWWGWGAKTTPLPLSMLIMDRNYDQRSVYTEADGKMLENAPAVDKDPGNELNDGNFFQRVRAYWQDAGFGPFE